jgi:hypothetical protein
MKRRARTISPAPAVRIQQPFTAPSNDCPAATAKTALRRLVILKARHIWPSLHPNNSHRRS